MAGNLVVSQINGAGIDNGNLVINPEFTINQRGAASRTATSSAYNYDRWYYDGTNLLQGIENLNLRNGTYVVSWEGSSTCSYSLNTASASSQGGQSYTAITSGNTFVISSLGSNNLWLKFNGDLTNLTKVKVTLGDARTDFVARHYGTELALCQRYYWKDAPNGTGRRFGSGGTNSSGTATRYIAQFPVTMRSAPTAIEQTGTATDYQIIVGSTTYNCSSVPTYVTASTQNALFQFTVSSVLTTGGYSQGAATGTDGYLAWSAEL